MGDRLPGWTCPDIDEVIKLLRKAHREALSESDLAKGVTLMENLREANTQLRKRCVELLDK